MFARKQMLSSVAGLAIATAACAATPSYADPIPKATSYADLFERVPDAAGRLNAADYDAQRGVQLTEAQYWRGGDHYYDHHHHHHHSARWFYQHGYVWNGWGWVPRPVYHHHHHHHHQHYGW